jgi:hypothetical protein
MAETAQALGRPSLELTPPLAIIAQFRCFFLAFAPQNLHVVVYI